MRFLLVFSLLASACCVVTAKTTLRGLPGKMSRNDSKKRGMQVDDHKMFKRSMIMSLKLMPMYPQMSKLTGMKKGMPHKMHMLGKSKSMKSESKGAYYSMKGKGSMMNSMMEEGPMGSSKGDSRMKMKKHTMMAYYNGKGTGDHDFDGPEAPDDEFPKCGCPECDETIWRTPVYEDAKETCGEKIVQFQAGGHRPEIAACMVVSDVYPSTCGKYCNPSLCGRNAKPTSSPTSQPPVETDSPTPMNQATSVPTDRVPETDSPSSSPSVETAAPSSPSTDATSSPTDGVPETDTPSTLPPVDTAAPTTSPSENPTMSLTHTTNSPTEIDPEGTSAPTNSPTESPLGMAEPRCGCDLCTEEILDTEVDGFTCQLRINFLISEDSFSEMDACEQVASEIQACAPCHPSCDGTPSLAPTSSPTVTTAPTNILRPTESPVGMAEPRCGCDLCTDEILGTEVDGFTCRLRIDFLISEDNFNEMAACEQVANEVEACAPCHPSCVGTPSLSPSSSPTETLTTESPVVQTEAPTTPVPTWTPTTDSPTQLPSPLRTTSSPTLSPTISEPMEDLSCGCPGCDEIIDYSADGISCRIRIQFSQQEDGFSEEEACTIVATDFPDTCGACNPNTCNDSAGGGGGQPNCGCETCTEAVLQTAVDGITCATRIAFAQTADGGGLPSELEACQAVANLFPETCGDCAPCR